MIILDQDLFFSEVFLNISIIIGSLTTFVEDQQRIGFIGKLDWFDLNQLKMTVAHYSDLSERIILSN